VPVIAEGVTAGGVDVGGLTEAQARRHIRDTVRPKALQRVWVPVGGKRYSLRMKRVRHALDARRSARRAFVAGVTAGPGAAVDLAIRFDRRRVREFVASVARRSAVAPRDAWLQMTARRMIRHRGRNGRAVDQPALVTRIATAIRQPVLQGRTLRPAMSVIEPRVKKRNLAALYPTVVTVDRRTFTLRLFKRLKLAKRYGVAVGAAGYDTPSGRYSITSKQVNPAWYAPNRPWAGGYAGRVVPGGAPDNPLKARWLGIVNGVGIHGTGEPWSIGSRASHGCIRMRVPDVIDLYPRIPVGTPVLIR
jgi:lipoprotein-anchoring transpeptidase ErfK/SrfK